jgi:serine/threonine-protein kinase
VPLGIEVIPSGTVPLVRRPPPASDQQTQMHDPLIGASIGEFQVTEMIGVGGMGMVYKGVHPLIGKTVAIKVLRPDVADDPEQVKRLLDEARALTAVRHRGIVDVFSFGTLPDGRPYLVMEYLQGQSMQELLEAGGRIELADALPIFDDVLTGLAAAHKVGLVHRDMKPSNIFLARESDGVTAKLVDFGIAKQGRPGAMTPQTVMFRCVGTPEFVSPEQACGKPVGPQSDLYSFGICAFFALTGRLPFEGEVDTEILMKQVEYPPPDPTSLEPSIPAPVSALIMRLMAKKPAERPASADQVRAELAAIGKRLKEPAPAAAAPAPGKPAQPTAPVDDEEARELRSWHRFRLTTALLLVLAVGCAVAWWFLRTK